MELICSVITTAIPGVKQLSYSKFAGFSISSMAFKMFKKYFSETNLEGCKNMEAQQMYRQSYGGGLTIHFRNYNIVKKENT